MNKILLVGCGKLGSRHLEGILNDRKKFHITVLDTAKQSIKFCKKNILTRFGKNAVNKILWLSKLSSKSNIKNFDLAIIATSSINRAQIIEKIAKNFKIKRWLIEKVLAQSTHDLKLIKKCLKNAKCVYVNVPRRQMKWYQDLKLFFKKKRPIKVIKEGNNWGLACNAVHFIDLVIWLTGEKLISVNTQKLEKNWFNSKRDGFFEINGELITKFSNGSKLILKSKKKIKKNILTINLSNKDKWEIFEDKGLSIFSSTSKNKKKYFYGKLELQSEMTGNIVNSLIIKNNCKLTRLSKAIKYHEMFLVKMLDHWNKTNNFEDIKLPIT